LLYAEFLTLPADTQTGITDILRVRSREAGITERTAALRHRMRADRAQTARLDATAAGITTECRTRWHHLGGLPPYSGWSPSSSASRPFCEARGSPALRGYHIPSTTWRATMEDNEMSAEQVSRSCSRESLHVGEPVTLVIEEERFFGWVASESQAHSIACVAIEFTRGDKRVQERIPLENIQRLRDYLQEHPELRKAKAKGA